MEGEQCSACQQGYFHLSESNAQGCLSCFCMGVTNQCTSSSYYRDKVCERCILHSYYPREARDYGITGVGLSVCLFVCLLQMEKDDKGSTMIRMGVSG